MSKRANSKLNTTGPTMKPIGPKNPNPPKMESKIRKGCIFIPRSINIGDRTLSESPTKAMPHSAKPIELASELVTKRYNIAGATTIDEPTIGIKEAKAVTVPQSIGLGMEKIANPKAVKKPFTRAIIREPLTIEFIDNPTFFIICSS